MMTSPRDILQSLYTKEKRSDFTVILSDTHTLKLHKLILDSSGYFSTLIESGFAQDDFVDLSDSIYMPVLEAFFRYLYGYPIDVELRYLSMFWCVLHYFQVESDEIIPLIDGRLDEMSVEEFHCNFRDVIVHCGNDYAEQIFGVLKTGFGTKMRNNFETFFEYFDYGSKKKLLK
eukprot:TRINITY_DN5769_c0_g1_i2.p1 TRINITY_DN5769_c0_g1~~TRINITY_DN5769_c0_g1_i2.p1  ORF type:complete len:174 (+),score=42.05 TRINITY_DN5769_c0_g1_i2:71-592(+)